MRVGGFRCSYGRRGNDFSGGEEIVAASLISKLGYTIAVLPKAKVTHHIQRSRYTLRHLKHTITAGLFTEYQAKVELRIPVQTSLRNTAKEFFKSLASLLPDFQAKKVGKKAKFVETYYFVYARWQLLLRQTVDFVKRFRKPKTRS